MFISMYEFSDYERYLLEVKHRTRLNKYDKRNLANFEMGYAGELQFFNHVKSLGGVKLWNTRFELVDEVQYDFLIFHGDYLLHFDIKNYYGNYHVVDNNFVKDDGHVIKDPVDQLLRADYLLKDFCHRHCIHYKVESFMLFINENFNVRGFSGHKRVLFYKDLERILAALNTQPTEEAISAARLIKSYHKLDTYKRIHYYNFEKMRKGIKCPKCRRFLRKFEMTEKKVTCICGNKISKQEAVRIAFDAISLLKKSSVKTSEVMDFTGIGRSTVQRVLSANYASKGSTKGKVYTINKSNHLFVQEAVLKYEIYKNKATQVPE